jgi:hypothetical protein
MGACRLHGIDPHAGFDKGRPAMRRIALPTLGLLLLMAPAAGQPSSPDVRQAASEIVAACAIGPTKSFKDMLRARLENFLQRAIETKSAKAADLNTIFAQMPKDTEEALQLIPAARGRQAFFAIYFNCIRHQVILKLKLFNVDFEDPNPPPEFIH